MRALLSLAIIASLGGRAAADDAFSEIMPGVREDGTKPSVFMSAVLGHVWNRTYEDNHRRGPTESDGWTYGINFRGEVANLISRYGGRFGGAFDFEMFLASGGVIDGPQEPKLSYVYIGFTPALLLGLVHTKSFSLSAELGMPITTDFVGASAGGVMHWGRLYVGYRIRSGKAWRDTEVLDERFRIGVMGPRNNLFSGRTFFGLEVIDGYSEDDMGRADLGTMFRGSYTMVSFMFSQSL